MRELNRLIFHHSASSLETTPEQIKQWHLDKGWSDVGYHHLVDRFGNVYPGRPIWKQGAHCRGSNTDSIGICLVGDNTKEKRKWTVFQVDAAEKLIRAYRLLIPNIPFEGHREMPKAHTLCPGVDVHEVFRV